MKNRPLLLLAIVVLLVLNVSAFAYSGGDGSAEEPYRIATPNDLNEIGANPDDWNAHFVMVNDVNLADYTGTQFNIIGNTSNPFEGIFDGNGYSISNFTYSTTSEEDIGIFSRVEHRNALIRNVRLINPDIYSEHAGSTVGTLVAVLEEGVISCCSSEGGELIAEHCGGGLVASNWNGTIIDSYSTTDVTEVDIFMKPDYFAGLVAKNSGDIFNCYSIGRVTASISSERGGLVASNSRTVSNSFWDTQTSTQPTSDGGTGKTTAQMQDPNTFLDAGWDFVGEFEKGPSDIWAEPVSGGYMILWWQLSPLPTLPSFSGGTGEPNDPYLISMASDLNKIGHNPRMMTKHFKLVDNVDLNEVNFFPIGNQGNYFAGFFDGNNCTISHFIYNSSVTDCVGFFEYVKGPNAEIRDLGLIAPDVNAGTGDCVGSMVGKIYDGSISNCCSEGGSVIGDDFVGGLVGLSEFGNIYNSYSTTSVMGDEHVGGLGGYTLRGTVKNCYTEGSVVEARVYAGGLAGTNSGEVSNCYAGVSVIGGAWVGGLFGFNPRGMVINCYSESSVTGIGDFRDKIGGLMGCNYYGTASNCYANGNVAGYDNLGGLVGYNWDSSITDCYATGDVNGGSGSERLGGLAGYNLDGTISNCYATGAVDGENYIGGLVGQNQGGTVSDSFWDIETGGPDNGFGTPLTTAQMQAESTFTSAGWDFLGEVLNGTDEIWRLCNEGAEYPQLNWQFLLVDFVCPDGVDVNDLGVLCEQWLLEELSADVWPDGGNGVVDFLDWAIFADGWQSTNDIAELADFVEQWLKTGANYYIADIAPAGEGDGIVNMRDFAALAENWLSGL